VRGRRIAVLALVCAGIVGVVFANGLRTWSATLEGFNEVPALSTVASGNFTAEISHDETAVSWELSYADLEGSVQQAHIHVGQVGVNGGISVFFCTNLGNGPAGTQACPPPPATIRGTFTAADVIGPAGQGVAPGEFAELLAAIRAGRTYANVHSTKFPGGEARGQLVPGNGNHGH
jgi:hypothetical protein